VKIKFRKIVDGIGIVVAALMFILFIFSTAYLFSCCDEYLHGYELDRIRGNAVRNIFPIAKEM